MVSEYSEAKWVAGCMSGTSLDGVDVSVIRTDGRQVFEFGDSYCRPYTEAERKILSSQLGSWSASDQACEIIETAHAEALSHVSDYELIGFHGQTFAHDPASRRTYQAGSGAVLAQIMNKPVVWDFRSADVKMGGQGAPLVPFFHHTVTRMMGAWEPTVILNLGGVGNMTWVDPMMEEPENEAAVLAFDTGPSNAILNDYMTHHLGKPYDDGGALAQTGDVNEALLAKFYEHPYFAKIPPKSLDRNDFIHLLDQVADLSHADAMATLNAMVATSIGQGIKHCPSPPTCVFVTGGGRHNETLMQNIASVIECPIETIEAGGFDGDMLEAQAFAYLAMRVMRGLPTSGPSTTGVSACVGGGRVSRPEADDSMLDLEAGE